MSATEITELLTHVEYLLYKSLISMAFSVDAQLQGKMILHL